MHAKRFLPGLILFLGLAQPALAAVSGPIELGVFPYLSTRALLDLYQPVRLHLAAETGRPGYATGDLLRLYLYGYLHRIRSSRRLEQETHRNVELMWLLKRLMPDFKTIADFRRDHPAALKRVGREFLLLCRRLDLFGGELLAIDGSKFRAVNARDRSFTPAKLAKLEREIDQTIARYLKDLERQDQAEVGTEGSRAVALREKIAALQERRC